jgi:hypothetical protein
VLLARIAFLAAAVGGLAAAAAAWAGGGMCDAPGLVAPGEPADPVCGQLVRSMATRTGIAVGLATVVVVLTMVGLSRISRGRVEASDAH